MIAGQHDKVARNACIFTTDGDRRFRKTQRRRLRSEPQAGDRNSGRAVVCNKRKKGALLAGGYGARPDQGRRSPVQRYFYRVGGPDSKAHAAGLDVRLAARCNRTPPTRRRPFRSHFEIRTVRPEIQPVHEQRIPAHALHQGTAPAAERSIGDLGDGHGRPTDDVPIAKRSVHRTVRLHNSVGPRQHLISVPLKYSFSVEAEFQNRERVVGIPGRSVQPVDQDIIARRAARASKTPELKRVRKRQPARVSFPHWLGQLEDAPLLDEIGRLSRNKAGLRPEGLPQSERIQVHPRPACVFQISPVTREICGLVRAAMARVYCRSCFPRSQIGYRMVARCNSFCSHWLNRM